MRKKCEARIGGVVGGGGAEGEGGGESLCRVKKIYK